MADAKISALTAIDAVAAADLFAIVDDPAGTPVTKKATASQVRTYILGLAEALVLSGSTSGTVTVGVPAEAGTTTFTLPASNGTSGYYLQTDGNGVTSWAAVSASPAGSSGQIQYNNAGSFGAANLWRESADIIALRNDTTAQTLHINQTYSGSGTNYARLALSCASGIGIIAVEAGGTGTVAGWRISQGGATRLSYADQVAGFLALNGYNFAIGNNVNTAARWMVETDGSGFAMAQIMSSEMGLAWSSSTTAAPNTLRANGDTIITRVGAGILKLAGASGTGPGVLTTTATVVASLPSASTAGAGARAFVTDADSTTFLATAAGSGANAVPVVSDGTNWLIG